MSEGNKEAGILVDKSEIRKVACTKERKRKFKKRIRESNSLNDNARPSIPMDESETKLCVVLWRAVVVQALYDISAGVKSGKMSVVSNKSLQWMLEKNVASNDNSQTDFEFVCELANLSPKKVRLIAGKIIQRASNINLSEFNSRTFRKGYMNRGQKRTASN